MIIEGVETVYDNVEPPKDGDVYITSNGTVVMSEKTFKEYDSIAQLHAVRMGNFIREE